MLTRDALLSGAASLTIERVELPALGDAVFVRELTLAERDRFEQIVLTETNPDYRAELLVRSLCDEAGKRLFPDADAKLLHDLGAARLQPAFATAMRLSALRTSDLEELTKNWQGEPDGASSSGSPATSEE
jgi:hypothetical protein